MVVLTAPPSVRVGLMTRLEELEALSDEWFDLWERCPEASPFQTPEWLLAWWQHLGGGELAVLTLRAGRRLAGLVPLFFYRYCGRRQVSPLGIGISDYLGGLWEPEAATAGARAVWEYLAANRDGWDVADFPSLPGQSSLLTAGVPSSLRWQQQTEEPCPAAALPPTVAAYEAGQSRHRRKHLRQHQRLLGEMGPISFEAATRATLPEMLEALFALHTRRWELRGQAGVLCEARVQAFHRCAAPALLRRGCLGCYGLRLAGRLIAVQYNFLAPGRVYSYLSGFDPDLERASPGAVLLDYGVRQAIVGGARELDFLRGEEDYKEVWGGRPRATYRLLLWHAGTPPAARLWCEAGGDNPAA